MEKSVPVAAAPPGKAAGTEEAAAPDEKPPRERRRLHVPTSVLVTVLVAALSVWVAPALTRQWDDRQKARELRVTIAEEIIVNGTRVIYASTRPPLAGYKPAADYDAMLDQWLQESAVVQAKLRAYFPRDVLDRWGSFDVSYARLLLLYAKALPAAQKRHAGKTQLELHDYFVNKPRLLAQNPADDALAWNVFVMMRPRGEEHARFWAGRFAMHASFTAGLIAARANEPPGLDGALALHVDEP